MNKMEAKLILIEGLPGSGKSSLLEELEDDYPVVWEFHTERKIITKHFGAFFKNKQIRLRNKNIRKLEDDLEKSILSSRFLDNSKSFEKIKLGLFKERLDECLKLKHQFVVKEGLLDSLLDKNRKDYIDKLKSHLKKGCIIFFLKISDKELSRRQIMRINKRGGKFYDKTDKQRNHIFLSQFKQLTRQKKVINLDAKLSPKRIAEIFNEKLKALRSEGIRGE